MICSLEQKNLKIIQIKSLQQVLSFNIDLERYMTIFSVESDEERLMSKLNKQNQELNGIKKGIEAISRKLTEEGVANG